MEIKLNASQRNAVYKYIKDGYAIIESGRRFGKTQTLCGIVKHWLEFQAKDGEYCVIIGRTTSSMLELRNRLFSTIFNNDYTYITLYSCQNYVGFEIYINKKCNIIFCRSLQEFFYNKNRGEYNGINISLLVGDELYIDPDWCKHTACAYTQDKDITALSCEEMFNKEDIEQFKQCVSKTKFDKDVGQYM